MLHHSTATTPRFHERLNSPHLSKLLHGLHTCAPSPCWRAVTHSATAPPTSRFAMSEANCFADCLSWKQERRRDLTSCAACIVACTTLLLSACRNLFISCPYPKMHR